MAGQACEVHPDIQQVLLTGEQIGARVRALGAEVSRDYAGRQPHLVIVLRGGFMFAADLARAITVPLTLDFVAIASYGDQSRTTGAVRILKDLEESVESRHVLIVEDIIDTGLTSSYLCGLLRDRKAATLELCVLLDKPSARKVACQARYTGFTVPDAFVVGYGLDYRQRYRELPYVGTLKPHVFAGG